MDVGRVLTTTGWVAGGIVAYELVRQWIVRRIKRRFDRAGRVYAEDRQIRLDRYKFATKSYVKTEVLNDPILAQAVSASAAERGLAVERVRDEVEGWLDEIIPSFNTWAYYRFGYVLARTVLNFAFEVIIDDASLRRTRKKIPEGAAVVYVFNHRSNADFILASVALASSIALSYAVGEWARVWPLDALFRRFGAYFVRRGFKNPLYHLTLARYIQLIVRRGVTQGVFPEGGLSRDGALREPKLGILEYIASLKGDPSFNRDVVFVPVGINYDRVLEDRSLLAEAAGGVALGKDSLASRLVTGWSILRRLPGTLAVNAVRAVLGRTGRYGYAAVVFGDPVSLGSYLSALHEDVFSLPAEERRDRIRRFAGILMSEIGRLIPATPATLVAETMLRSGKSAWEDGALQGGVALRIAELRTAGRPLAFGREFGPIRLGQARLDSEGDRRRELFEEERRMVAGEEAELTLRLGLEFLSRRKAIRSDATAGRVEVTDPAVLRFYARSLDRSL